MEPNENDRKLAEKIVDVVWKTSSGKLNDAREIVAQILADQREEYDSKYYTLAMREIGRLMELDPPIDSKESDQLEGLASWVEEYENELQKKS